MKKLLLRTLFFIVPFLYSVYASSAPAHFRPATAGALFQKTAEFLQHAMPNGAAKK
jgi:hypothetical protein